MNNTIKCKKCGAEIEVSEALTHQIEEQVLASLEIQHKKELEEVTKLAEENADKKAQKHFEFQLIAVQKEKDEEKERNKKLTGQISELLDEVKKLRVKDEERDIEMKKKMMEEEEKIKKEVRKQADDEHQLKDLEKDKKLTDALKQVDELKTRMQQGSQQTQGEVLELELERILKSEFPQDNLKEVKKGERGADIVHEVIDKLGRGSGTILWESKNAKWQGDWISKLKEDQRAKKSELAVLVTINKPDWLESFTYKDGVWVTTWQFVVPLAFALRFNLISLNHEKASGEGKNEKMEILFQYLTGTEFKHRVEAIVEAFSNLQDELEKEKRYFSAKWGRQEKEIRKVLDHTHGMYGDLQGIIGRSLPEIKTLELPEKLESNDE
jgi:hypothetical protein